MSVGTAIGAGIQGVQAIGSGIAGKRAQQNLNNQVNTTNQSYNQMLGMGMDTIGSLSDMAQGFQNPTMRDAVANQAAGLGDILTRNANEAAAQLGAGGGMDIARNALSNEFDFSPVGTQLQQATQFAREEAARARAMSSDQMALANRNAGSVLDQQLAARGLSRNSGVSAAALSQLQQQNALTTAQLEGSLANQAAQTALGAAQLDSSNLLNQQGMASQFRLGMNQLGAQTGLGIQGMHDQNVFNSAVLRNDAAMQGFNALQGTYATNYLNPQLQSMGMLGSLAGSIAGIGAGGLQTNLGMLERGAQAAGSGKGAALGGLGTTAQDNLTSSIKPQQEQQGWNPRMGTR